MANSTGYPGTQPRGRSGVHTFGVLSIVIGSLAGCFSLLTPLALMIPRPEQRGTPMTVPTSTLVTGMMVYVALAMAFIWVGIGCCKCRRWVRPLILCMAWPWLVTGLLTVLYTFYLLMNPSQMSISDVPAPARSIGSMFIITMLGIIYVVLPSAYIVYFQRQSVRVNLLSLDPHPRWTDCCPVPVLGISLWLLISGVATTMMLGRICLPFFGIYLTGMPAAILAIILGLVLIYTAWCCYRLQSRGWWLALATVLFWTFSATITFQLSGIAELYRQSQIPEAQVAMMEKQILFQSPYPVLLGCFFGAVYIGYLMFVRRYFNLPQARAIV